MSAAASSWPLFLWLTGGNGRQPVGRMRSAGELGVYSTDRQIPLVVNMALKSLDPVAGRRLRSRGSPAGSAQRDALQLGLLGCLTGESLKEETTMRGNQQPLCSARLTSIA